MALHWFSETPNQLRSKHVEVCRKPDASNDSQSVSGITCVVIVVAWMIFLGVVITAILADKGLH